MGRTFFPGAAYFVAEACEQTCFRIETACVVRDGKQLHLRFEDDVDCG